MGKLSQDIIEQIPILYEKLKTKTDYFVKNMNTIIGLVTGFVAILTLINILNYYFN